MSVALAFCFLSCSPLDEKGVDARNHTVSNGCPLAFYTKQLPKFNEANEGIACVLHTRDTYRSVSFSKRNKALWIEQKQTDFTTVKMQMVEV